MTKVKRERQQMLTPKNSVDAFHVEQNCISVLHINVETSLAEVVTQIPQTLSCHTAILCSIALPNIRSELMAD